MGFWNDVANFAVGAIEQDKANTKERFAIRAEELQANRASLLKRKDKRYEKDIENYYKEKEKFKTVESANAAFAKDNNVAQYAAKILPITTPGWKDLPEKLKTSMINNYSGKTIDYKMKGSLDQIEQNAAMADAAITRYTSAALDDARGDRFLINKILGTKSKSEAEQLKDMEAAIKANNAIKLTETSVNPEFVGLDVKGTGGIYSNIDKTSDSYKTFRNKNYEQLKKITDLNAKVTSKDNNEAMKASFKNLGITNTKDYFKENRDKEIISFQKGGENFAESVYSAYKHNQDFLKRNGTDYLFVKFDGQIGELPSYYGKSNMNGTVANRIKEYAVPVESNNILGEGGSLDFKTVLRGDDSLIVVPTANTIDFDNTIFGSNRVLSDSEKSKVSQIYAKVLMAESSVPNKQGVMELNPKFLKQNQATLQNLKYGETNTLLNSVNFNFGVALIKEGLLTKEQFLENNNNNRLYNFKNNKDETPFKDIVDNIKVTNVNQEDNQGGNNQNKDNQDSIKVTFSDGKTKTFTANQYEKAKSELEKDKDNIINQEIVKPIKEEEKIIDNIKSDTVTKKLVPSNFGIKNKPVFESLEEVTDIIKIPMSGKEIKEKYDINFPVNENSMYMPTN